MFHIYNINYIRQSKTSYIYNISIYIIYVIYMEYLLYVLYIRQSKTSLRIITNLKE